MPSAPPCRGASGTLGQPGDQWFVEEVHPHDAALKAYLRGRFPGESDVDEVVQESYVRVWKARASRPIRSIKAFLFRVAGNLALDRVRRNRVTGETLLGDLAGRDVIDENSNVTEALTTQEKERLLAEALAALPARAHEVVVYCKLQGLSHREVGQIMGISERTVDEHLRRGMIRLGKELRKRGMEGFYR